MSQGYCTGCNQVVEIDSPPDGHSRAEHDRSCDGNCRRCPVQVLCGPVISQEQYEAELAKDYDDLCSQCGKIKNDSTMHHDAPGANWGAALHWFQGKEQA